MCHGRAWWRRSSHFGSSRHQVLHHDIMTATSEDASFPWFLVLSRRQCAKEKQNTYAICHSASQLTSSRCLSPASIRPLSRLPWFVVRFHLVYVILFIRISSSCLNSASMAGCSHGPFSMCTKILNCRIVLFHG